MNCTPKVRKKLLECSLFMKRTFTEKLKIVSQALSGVPGFDVALFRKIKTSDFFDGNIRTFDAKHPYFVPKKSDVLQLPDRMSFFFLQIKFLKHSYISYITP